MADSLTSISDSNGFDNKQHLSWSNLGIHNYIKIAIITGLFVCLFYVEIYRIAYRWFNDFSSWGHGVLIPLFSLYFLNQQKKEILTLKTHPNYLGLFFLICCIVFYPSNIVHFKISYARALIMIPTIGSIVLLLGGWKLVKYTWLPIIYLFFAIPMPERIHRAITMPMRYWAAQIATMLLNFVEGMYATANGVVIDVVYKGVALKPSLDVAEACSGMRLLMAFLALGVAMAYLHYRPMWQRVILLITTVPIAIFCNIIRVTITGFIYILIGPKYAQGIYHDFLGMAMLPLAFTIYGILASFMASLFMEEKAVGVENVIFRRQN